MLVIFFHMLWRQVRHKIARDIELELYVLMFCQFQLPYYYCFVVKLLMSIPPHQAFALLPTCYDLLSYFLYINADATSEWGLEGFETIDG